MSDLLRLSKPFAPRFISQLPGKGQADYVSHAVVTEALLAIVGPFDWSVREFRDSAGSVAGCVGTLRVTIDGRETTITEAGDTSGQEKNDGERLKNAASDAIKRCAMRVGLGLHLWAQEHYVLYDQLAKSEGGADATPAVSGEGEQSSATPTPATHRTTELDVPNLDPCQECGRDQLPLAENGGHAPRCSRNPKNKSNA